jgi:hypothetical protein
VNHEKINPKAARAQNPDIFASFTKIPLNNNCYFILKSAEEGYNTPVNTPESSLHFYDNFGAQYAHVGRNPPSNR